MTSVSRDKGKSKEKSAEPHNSRSSNLGLRAWLSRVRGRPVIIRDTQSTPEPVPRHLDDTEYDSPSPPQDEEFPPEFFIAKMAAAQQQQQQHSAHSDVPPARSTRGSGIGGSATPGGSIHDSRVMIYPRGNEFSKQKLCATAISSIMMCKFEGPYDSFTKVPLDTRDLWFREFELMFRWRPEDSGEIRRIFGVVGGKSLKHKVYKARKNNKRPYWIPASAWADRADLLMYWASETYKKKAATNKKNRSSDGGGRGFPLHFGGSISHLTHRDRLRERLGRDPTLVEGFCCTHVQVQPDGTERWSDNVSRSLHDSYVEKYDAAPSSDGSSPSVHLDVEIERWTEVAGGEKKGSVPGLAGLVARRHGLHVPLTQQTQTQREEQLQKEVEELRSQYADVQMELQTQNTHLQAQLSQQGQELQAQRREMDLIRQMFAQMQHQQSPLVQPVPSFPIPTPSWPPFNPSAPNVDELNIPPNTDDDHCDEDI